MENDPGSKFAKRASDRWQTTWCEDRGWRGLWWIFDWRRQRWKFFKSKLLRGKWLQRGFK
jgi:hypothetical protein